MPFALLDVNFNTIYAARTIVKGFPPPLTTYVAGLFLGPGTVSCDNLPPRSATTPIRFKPGTRLSQHPPPEPQATIFPTKQMSQSHWCIVDSQVMMARLSEGGAHPRRQPRR